MKRMSSSDLFLEVNRFDQRLLLIRLSCRCCLGLFAFLMSNHFKVLKTKIGTTEKVPIISSWTIKPWQSKLLKGMHVKRKTTDTRGVYASRGFLSRKCLSILSISYRMQLRLLFSQDKVQLFNVLQEGCSEKTSLCTFKSL